MPSATSATRPRRRSSACLATPIDEIDVPDFCFMLADVVVAFDHARRVMQVIAPVRPGGAPEAAYDAALKRIDTYLRRIDKGPARCEAR